jgi:hypothetical protein
VPEMRKEIKYVCEIFILPLIYFHMKDNCRKKWCCGNIN